MATVQDVAVSIVPGTKNPSSWAITTELNPW